MDLQLFICINLAALSGLAIVLDLLAKHQAQYWKSGYDWIAVHAAVLIVCAFTLKYDPEWAGAITAYVFLLLVSVPGLLISYATRWALMSRTSDAAYLAKLGAFVHPSKAVRHLAGHYAALAQPTLENQIEALRQLADKASSGDRAVTQAWIYRLQGNWQGVLEATRAAATPTSGPAWIEILALGELGHAREMVQVYAAKSARINAQDLFYCQLFVLAFSGRSTAVELMHGRADARHDPEAKVFWRATAGLAAGTDTEKHRHNLIELAAATHNPRMKAAIEQRLAIPAEGLPAALTVEDVSIVDAIETRLLREPPGAKKGLRQAPITWALVMAIAAAFLAEIQMGGSENYATLVDMGALWPPLILENGEWWRLISASFLHFGALHFFSNVIILWLLGSLAEARWGSTRTLLVYGLGGLFSSASVLWLMHAGYSDYGLLVGASGAIFALMGLETARRIRNWRAYRDDLDRRGIVVLALVMLIQVVIDLSVPQISFMAHASGFLTGLLLGFVFSPSQPRLTASKEV